MPFVPHQGVDTVLLGEPFGQVIFVLPNALGEVGSDAHIQRTVLPAGKEIDPGVLLGKCGPAPQLRGRLE